MFKYNRVLTSQPQGAVEIDWSNPLTRGLALAFDGATNRDVVRNKQGVATGTKRAVGQVGVGTGFSTDGVSTTDKVLTGVAGNGVDQRTLFSLFTPRSLGGGSLGRLTCANNLADEMYLYNTTIEMACGYFRHTNGSFRSIQFGSYSALVFGKPMCLSISYDGSSVSNLPVGYVNGKLVSSGCVDSPSAPGVLNPDNICIGNRPTDNLRVFDGTIFLTLRWDRILSGAEHAAIADNPWQIFKPRTFLLGSLTSPQLLYPTGDVAGGTWLASTGTDLFACIDETAASDADYIYTTVPGAYQEFSFPDGGAVDPSTGGHVRYRLPAGTGTITAILKQGSTTLQTLGTHTLTGSAQDIDITISASVADSDDLRVGFTASA